MFKMLLEYGVTFLLALTIITQLIVPLFVPKLELFWIFKRKTVPTIIPHKHANVDELLHDMAKEIRDKKKGLDVITHQVEDSIDLLKKAKEEVK